MMSDPAPLLIKNIARLRRYAQVLTGDAGRADDLVQDSLERAWGRIALWRGNAEGDMRPWLFTIMHNVFVNHTRRYAREPTFVELDENDAPTQVNQQSAFELRELQAAIETLPEPQREVLLLVGLEQMPYQEVADILGIPVGTVMSRLARARQRLRTLLQEGGSQRPHLRSVK